MFSESYELMKVFKPLSVEECGEIKYPFEKCAHKLYSKQMNDYLKLKMPLNRKEIINSKLSVGARRNFGQTLTAKELEILKNSSIEGSNKEFKKIKYDIDVEVDD